MSKVYDDYLEKKMEADDILEEIHKVRYGDDGELDQLRSDNEDLKSENLKLLEANVKLRGKLIKIMEVIGEADKSDGDNYFI